MHYKIQNAIFHWYSGGLKLIKNISDAGFYFSINPAMAKSKSGQKIISKIPKEKILTETDGPFINKGSEPLLPGEIEEVLIYLSEIWKIEILDVQNIINMNFKKLIGNLNDN